MPTYEYHCKKCDFRFDYFQDMTEKPLKKCPECGGQVERLIGGGSGIVFKGSGFYETDYKRKSGESSRELSTKTTEVKKPGKSS